MADTTAESKDVSTRDASGVTAREPETVMRPAVDIYEDAEGITLLADMAGVDRERLNLEVDRDSLTIEGDTRIDLPEGMAALYADVHSTRYRRSFTLSGELAVDEVKASLRDGVLTVTIPKRAEVRPRKVEVRVD
jgi:HSP20 family protein